MLRFLAKVSKEKISDLKGFSKELIVKHYHEKSFHASVRYTWNKMRRRYWIRHGRVYIKKILRKICKGCAMWVATPFEQPDFPPLLEFQDRLKQGFISRRKQPKHIISDNAKNLIAASKVIVELNRMESGTMEWEFITPGAPWQGCICERIGGSS
ncbi:unnamed protein product [Acanthocheilonema viteae]|uniref:Integrase zinc-binding domain-containing protein n=1 Tax=Acanthocheilonema viteae TaxID=6277 RepID=A0A498SEM7_ACAVI|nr:unnamed protein product [Acanthocheilonema viteae]